MQPVALPLHSSKILNKVTLKCTKAYDDKLITFKEILRALKQIILQKIFSLPIWT